MTDTFAPIDPKLIDVVLPEHDGYPEHLAAEDTPDVLWDVCGSASREFPDALWIEPEDWEEKARENDEYHTWPMNYVDRYSNQNPSHECTAHALRVCAEACRNRQRGVIFPAGPKKGFRYEESESTGSVWLSPLSVYAEANPGEWGGANCKQVLEIACRRGFIPDKIQPAEYNFRHVLQGTSGQGNSNQSRGPFVRVSQFPDGWEETAKWFKPIEVIFPRTWEQGVCLVLHGMAVEVGRSGHAIPYSFWSHREQAMGYIDSYDVTRYDSIRTVQSCIASGFAIASMTTPDDWLRPGG